MVKLVARGGKTVPRATVMEQKTGQHVKCELTGQTREAVEARIIKGLLTSAHYVFLVAERRIVKFLDEFAWYARALKAARECDQDRERSNCSGQQLIASQP